MSDSYSVSKSQLEMQKSRLYALKEKCRTARSNNEKFEEATIKHNEAIQNKQAMETFLQAVVDNHKHAVIEYGNYKERRLDFIESNINKKLDEIFPSDNYKLKLRVDNTRKEKTIFQLNDKNGIPRSTRVSAGGLMQSLIAYGVSVDISDSLGSSKIWVDEAFAASSAENLTKLSAITEHYLELGFQIFMVEHKEEGYKNLPRREFELIKDLETGRIAGIEYTDY